MCAAVLDNDDGQLKNADASNMQIHKSIQTSMSLFTCSLRRQ